MKRNDQFLERVDDLLDEFIETKRGSGVWGLKDSMPDIKSKMEWAIARGEISLNIDAILWTAIQKADERRRARGQRLITQERARQAAGWMSLDDGAWLDVIVALGKGDRCRYGDFHIAELMRADNLKRDNWKAVNESWADWELDRDALIPPLEKGMSIQHAFEAKLITRVPDLFSTSMEDN